MPVLGRAFSFLPERNNANLPSEQFFPASKRRNPLPICILLPAGFPRSLIRKSLALRTGSCHSAPVFFSEIILTEIVAMLSGAFARSRFANMYTIGCTALRGHRNNIIRKPVVLGCGKFRARRSRRRATRSYHFGSEFLTNSLSMRFTILGGFIQTIFISLPPCTH